MQQIDASCMILRFSDFIMSAIDFIIKCVLNIRNSAILCVEQKGGHFEQLCTGWKVYFGPGVYIKNHTKKV